MKSKKKKSKPLIKKGFKGKIAKSLMKQIEFGKNYGKQVTSIAKSLSRNKKAEAIKKFLPAPKMQPLPKPAKRVKVNPVGKVIKSHKLSNRVKVTPEQLERIKGMEGEGVSSTYNEQGEKELSLIRKLALAKKKAPKFVLYTDQLGRRLYVGSRIHMGLKPKDNTTAITFDIKQALHFYEGFDNPSDKIKFYHFLVPILAGRRENGDLIYHNLEWKSAKLFTRNKIENETLVD